MHGQRVAGEHEIHVTETDQFRKMLDATRVHDHGPGDDGTSGDDSAPEGSDEADSDDAASDDGPGDDSPESSDEDASDEDASDDDGPAGDSAPESSDESSDEDASDDGPGDDETPGIVDVTFQVVSGDTPTSGARIQVRGESGGWLNLGLTDAEGKISATLASGDYSVRVQLGSAKHETTITVGPTSSFGFDLAA